MDPPFAALIWEISSTRNPKFVEVPTKHPLQFGPLVEIFLHLWLEDHPVFHREAWMRPRRGGPLRRLRGPWGRISLAGRCRGAIDAHRPEGLGPRASGDGGLLGCGGLRGCWSLALGGHRPGHGNRHELQQGQKRSQGKGRAGHHHRQLRTMVSS